MSSTAAVATNDLVSPQPRYLRWTLGTLGLLLACFLTAAFAGPRYGLILLIGLATGLTLEGLRFGFAGPWRQMILHRNPQGLLAQLLAIGLVSVVAIPLLSSNSGELIGGHAPIGIAMLGGAFVFGICMQLLLGCGSGTLVNAGSGSGIAVVALPFFALGSFLGAYHLDSWTRLGSLELIVLQGNTGLAMTLAGLLIIALVVLKFAQPGNRKPSGRLVLAALLVAALAIVHLVTAGQPWGVVYGLGLWVAKGTSLLGFDLSGSAFWSSAAHQTRINESILTDVTSLTNIGLIAGAALMTWVRNGFGAPVTGLSGRTALVVVLAGLLLGYTARLAFGCNVGAFFSGISTGSAHGWAWFVMAFAGSWVGIKARPLLGLEART